MNQNQQITIKDTLKFGYHQIEVVTLRGSPYIVGNSIIRILGLSLNSVICNIINQDMTPFESGMFVIRDNDRDTVLVNLKGIYTLLNLGNSTKYRRFEQWAMDNLYPIWMEQVA